MYKLDYVIEATWGTGFGFSTSNEIYVEEFGSECDFFRLEVLHNGEMAVCVASQDDYFVYEDCTELFELEELYMQLERQAQTNWEYFNHTEFYNEFQEENKEV